MGLNNARKQAIEYRRELVAQMRLRGMTERAIAENLQKVGIKVSFVTIHDDLQVLEARWRERSVMAISDRKALHIAKLEEVERSAWTAKKLRDVLGALDQQAKVLGLNAPTESIVTEKKPDVIEIELTADDTTNDESPGSEE